MSGKGGLIFVLSTIASIYTVSQLLENMRNAAAQRQREDEILILLRRIDAKLATRTT